MRRYWVVALAVLTLLGVLSPPVWAQAPAAPTPKVTITGLVDMLTNTTHNLRDAHFGRAGDTEWYSRTRFRPDIIAEVGKAKMVLGLEIDTAFGQVSGADSNIDLLGAAGTAQRAGTTSGFDLNTDTQGSIEVKWAYLEFPVPLVPFPTTLRVGAQSFATTYKLATLATGDFSGFNLVTTWAPNVKSHIAYAQIEEELTGGSTGGTGATAFARGDDFALILGVEYTPMKGLDVRPIYALAWFQGATSGSARQGPGQITGAAPAFLAKTVGPGLVATHEEWRHTIGIDARWTSGALFVNPTFFYQFGTRDTDNPAPTGTTNLITEADISAWLLDLHGGYRWGPLLLEARYMYSSGNRPKDQLWRDVNYYQPINADTGYWADYRLSNIWGLGIDYFNGAILGMGANLSVNRYGRQQFAVRGTYNVVPALDLYAVVSPAWTARSVNTAGNPFGAANCPSHAVNVPSSPTADGAGCNGDSSYLGTEGDLGLTWRFAPGLTFELVGGILFAGEALDRSEVRNGILTKREAEDAYIGTARVRFSF